jgi:magnesium-transporting ATPase (P-type)
MNYKEYQEKQKNAGVKPVHQARSDKPNRRPFNWDKFWNFLSEAANPFQIIAILTMLIFGFARLPEIPAVFCFITFFLFIVSSIRKKSFEWLSIIWLFNGIIWSFNSIFLR